MVVNREVHKVVDAIRSHEELADILRDIAKNPPRFLTILTGSRSNNWPIVKSICLSSSKRAVEVDDNTIVGAWDGDDNEMEYLGEIVRMAHGWQGFYFFANGKLHEVVSEKRRYELFYFWMICYAEYLKPPHSVSYCEVLSRWYTRYGIWGSCTREAPYDNIIKDRFEKIDAIKSEAESMGMVICPRFTAENFRKASASER